MKYNILLISLCSLLLFSCKTQLKVVKPAEAYVTPLIEVKPSTMSVTVDLDIPQLEKALNKNLQGVLYEDNRIDDDNLMVKVTKVNDFRFSLTGNVISCALPLNVWVKTGYKKEALGLKFEDYYEATGSLSVNVNLAFSVTKDWTIQTQTNITGYNWIQKPVIKAAVVDIPVTFIADVAIKSMKSKIAAAVDKSIGENTELRKVMSQTWAEIQNPILLDKTYNVWMKVSPQGISSTPLLGSGNRLVLNLGVTGVIETNVGTKQFAGNGNNAKLPEYKVVSSISPDFAIHSNIYLPFSKIEEIAKQMVVGQEFTQGKKKVKIESVHLYGQNDCVIAQVSVSGSARGDIFCKGKLAFDNASQSLNVNNFDFEVNTKNALVKSANWLLHKKFLSMIEPMLTVSLKNEIGGAFNSANTILKSYNLYKGVTLNGNLKNIQVRQINIVEDAVIVSGAVNGNLKVNVGEIF